MDVPILNSSVISNDVEMSSLQDIGSVSEARENTEVAARNIERRNLKRTKEVEKKKSANIKRKRSENVTEKKKEENTRPNSSLSKNSRKKKAESKEKSENDGDHETANEETLIERTAKISKENKSDNVNSPKRKTAKTIKFSNTREGTTEDNAGLKTDRNKNLIGKDLVAEEQSENDAKQESENVTASLKRNKKSEENKGSAKKIAKSANVENRNDDPKSLLKNDTNVEENKNNDLKRTVKNTAVHPPISEMVLDSFIALRKRNGTSTEEIVKYIDENYQVNINRIKPHVKKFLQKSVADGLFDLVKGTTGDLKFKTKKAEGANKGIVKIKKTTDELKKRTRNVEKVKGKAKKESLKGKQIKTKGKKEASKGKTQVRKSKRRL